MRGRIAFPAIGSPPAQKRQQTRCFGADLAIHVSRQFAHLPQAPAFNCLWGLQGRYLRGGGRAPGRTSGGRLYRVFDRSPGDQEIKRPVFGEFGTNGLAPALVLGHVPHLLRFHPLHRRELVQATIHVSI